MGKPLVRKDEPVSDRMYRMTAKSDYANGAIAWPEGMTPFWPKDQERIVPQSIYDRVLRDGVSEFDVKYYTPPEPPPAQPTTEPAAAPDKRLAALEKARAAKAAKKAAKD
jgi:hypothetical protein